MIWGSGKTRAAQPRCPQLCPWGDTWAHGELLKPLHMTHFLLFVVCGVSVGRKVC